MPRDPLPRPGWPEITAGLATYVILIFALALWLLQIPDTQAALRGISGMAINGVAGTLALLVACALRIRDLRAFGFRTASLRWILISAGLGVIAVGLSIGIEHVYFSFITEPDTQGDFHAAARSGTAGLLVLVIAGAVFTPFGEEVLFRGVIANALNRYGLWPGILGSAVIFAAVHGPSVIFFNALMAGILTGAVFRKTGSLWPTLVLHGVYNGIWLLIYGLSGP